MSSLSPHDHLFKGNLQNVTIARDFFIAHLPNDIKDKFDLSNLTLCNNAFLGKNFKQRFSDVIYTTRTDGHLNYLYLLAEHQSTPHPLMPFRVLHYQCHILHRHLDQHPNCTTLPAIYGLVFYHGKKTPYPYTTQITECFSNPDFARKNLLKGFQLVDIGQIEDSEIKRHQSVAVMEILQKHYRNKNLLDVFRNMKLFLQGLLNMDLRDALFYNIQYLLTFLENEDSEKLLDGLVLNLPNELRGEIMSIAEQLRQKGLEEGKREGKQEGKREGKQEVAKKLITSGHSLDFVSQMTGLKQEQLETL